LKIWVEGPMTDLIISSMKILSEFGKWAESPVIVLMENGLRAL
jgi:hypothetical protein